MKNEKSFPPCFLYVFLQVSVIFFVYLKQSFILTAILFSSLYKNASSSCFYSLSLVKMSPFIVAFFGSPLRLQLNFFLVVVVVEIAVNEISH